MVTVKKKIMPFTLAILTTLFIVLLSACGSNPYSPWVGDSEESVKQYFEENGLENDDGEKWVKSKTAAGYVIEGWADYFSLGTPSHVFVGFDRTDPDGATNVDVVLSQDYYMDEYGPGEGTKKQMADCETVNESLDALDRPDALDHEWEYKNVMVKYELDGSVFFYDKDFY